MSDADLKGKWSVVFFYPADFTFACPTELEDLADNYAEFQKMGIEIYSVSTDTHFCHKAWHDSSSAIKKIQYTMVGDRWWRGVVCWGCIATPVQEQNVIGGAAPALLP